MKRQTPTNFFFHNAGSSYTPSKETRTQGRWRGAKALARAEQWARDTNCEFTWEQDNEPCIGCDCGSADCACSSGADHETLGCVLRDSDGKILASLWSICGATREYKRVVEAELAFEAMP